VRARSHRRSAIELQRRCEKGTPCVVLYPPLPTHTRAPSLPPQLSHAVHLPLGPPMCHHHHHLPPPLLNHCHHRRVRLLYHHPAARRPPQPPKPQQELAERHQRYPSATIAAARSRAYTGTVDDLLSSLESQAPHLSPVRCWPVARRSRPPTTNMFPGNTTCTGFFVTSCSANCFFDASRDARTHYNALLTDGTRSIFDPSPRDVSVSFFLAAVAWHAFPPTAWSTRRRTQTAPSPRRNRVVPQGGLLPPARPNGFQSWMGDSQTNARFFQLAPPPPCVSVSR
jgi:hypothetical protein